MKQALGAVTLLLLLGCPALVLAQDGAPAKGANDQPARFPSVGQQLPALLSGSGRFSAINPPNQGGCGGHVVSGHVVSRNLIYVKESFDCDGGFRGHGMLVNVELADPADAAKMIPGSAVIAQGKIKDAHENHNGYPVFYIFVENTRILSFGSDIDPEYANFNYMNCQPPELDALAKQLGRELCVQNTLVTNLAATGQALEAAARAPVKVSPDDTAPGGPDAITCRLDPGLSSLHLQAIACARNSYWAGIK